MKKSFKKALAAVALVFALLMMCSCMRMEMGIVINEDGTAKVFSEVTMSEATLTQLEQTKEEFMQSLRESEDSEQYEGWEMEEVERIVSGEIGDETYIGMRYYKTGTLEEVVAELGDTDESSNITFDTRKENGENIVNITLTNNEGGSAGGEVEEYVSQGMMTTYFTVTVPTEITSSNGVISADKKTATWDILDIISGADKEKNMVVSYKDAGSPVLMIVLIAVGAVVLIGIVVAVIVICGKKKPQPVADTPMNYSIPQAVPVTNAVPAQETAPVQTAAPVAETAPVQAEAPAEAAPAEEKAFCINCGTKLEPGSAFCTNCGEKV